MKRSMLGFLLAAFSLASVSLAALPVAAQPAGTLSPGPRQEEPALRAAGTGEEVELETATTVTGDPSIGGATTCRARVLTSTGSVSETSSSRWKMKPAQSLISSV